MPDAARVLEIPASLPPDGSRVWYFPGAVDRGRADIVARVYRRDGSSWIACLGTADSRLETSEDIFVLPCGERLFIAGGVVDRDDPETWRSLGFSSSARASWTPGRTFAVLNDHASVHVFGPSGPLWSGALGSDVAVSAVTADLVVCDVYDWEIGRTVERRFDLRTGREIDSDTDADE